MDSGSQQMANDKTHIFKNSAVLGGQNDQRKKHGLAETTVISCNDSESHETMKLLERSKKEFYKNRKVIIRNIPPCSYEEVKDFMSGHAVCNITISKKSRHAVVTLQHGERAVEIASALVNKLLLNAEVSVSFYPSDRLLCVAHLPSGFTEENFEDLVSTYGPVEKCYLMRDEFTGASKGYGFVEYCVNREKSILAKDELDWKRVDRSCVQCDIVSCHQSEYSQLNSRCLLVENLPKDYRDDCHLRDIFSLFSPPAYCRILIKKNETPLGVAIVEYTDHHIAARTCHQLHQSTVKGSAINISYCLVGKTAIDIYNRFMRHIESSSANGGNTHKSGLLPNPVVLNENVLNSPLMKSLTNRQPQLMPKLRQALKELQASYGKQLHGRNKQGLLGPAPSMMNPLMNPNLQLGLATMLSLQLQTQTGIMDQCNQTTPDALNLLSLLQSSMTPKGSLGTKPSLLGDPITAQGQILVQNLMSQLNGNIDCQSSSMNGSSTGEEFASSWKYQQDPTEKNLKNLNINWLLNLGQIVTTVEQNLQHIPSSATGALNQSKAQNSRLGDASSYFNGTQQNTGIRSWPNHTQQMQKVNLLHEKSFSHMAEDSKENFLCNLQPFATQSSESKHYIPGENNNRVMNNDNINNNIPKNHISNNAHRGNELYLYNNVALPFQYGHNNNMNSGRKYQNNKDSQFPSRSGSVDFTNSTHGINGSSHSNRIALLPEPYPNPSGLNSTAFHKTSTIHDKQTSFGNVQNTSPLLPSPFAVSGPQSGSPVPNNNTTQSSHFFKQKALLPDPYYQPVHQLGYPDNHISNADPYSKAPSLLHTPISHSILNNNTFSHGLNHYNKQSGIMKNFNKPQPLLPDPVPRPLEGEPFSPMNHVQRRTVGAVGSKSTGLLATPIGKKRSYSCLLPAPETSPDGDYIGQHSQGIGGHYAETHLSKRRRNESWQPQSLFRS